MDGIDLTGVLVNLLLSAVAVAVLMAATMAYGLRTRNHSIVDTIWGLGFVVVAVVSFLLSLLIDDQGDQTRRVVVLAITAVWGIRLGTYIHHRNTVRYGAAGDPRYVSLMKRNTGREIPFVVRTVYRPQGVIMWVVSIPVQVAMYESSPAGPVTWVGLAVAVVGFTLESVGDAQLARFKADPANAGLIMDRGLWGWTRHPNYFGDACLWTGLWLIAGSHWIGLLTVFSPILMTFFLIARSGKALLERRMARAKGPAYEDYVARTSGFLPLPPKRRTPTH